MLSKRASTQKRFRIEKEIYFIPSTRVDMVRSVCVFLREINQPPYPYQITVTFNDMGFGRLGYYDLSYSDLSVAQSEYARIVDAIEEVREHVEFNQISSFQIEKLLRVEIDKSIKDAVIFDSTYHGKRSA